MEKKIAIILGIIMVTIILGIVTGGKSWSFIIIALIAWAIYKNNRF